MIKKIQKYLLLHYPLIWNIRLVPMLLILLGIHLLFFGIGYSSADASFFEIYHYHNEGVLYFVSVLVGILVFVGWAVFYNRNNGLKNFYPKKTAHLYAEWLMIVVIVAGITFIPVTMTVGSVMKWRSVATLQETKDAIGLLEKVEILIPSTRSEYKYDQEYHRPVPFPDMMKYQLDTLDRNAYLVEYDSEKKSAVVRGYIAPSLLFYDGYSYHYSRHARDMDSERIRRKENQEMVKKWLRNGEKDSIYALMKVFDDLRKKHHLKADLTLDEWFRRIYHPPFFPVNGSTVINNDIGYSSGHYVETEVEMVTDGDSVTVSKYIPALPHNNLKSGYDQVLDYYYYGDDFCWMSLVCLCVSLGIAAFVFSFRITKRKPWLTSFIATGIMMFITGIIAIALDWKAEIAVMYIALFWLLVFAVMLSRVIAKIRNKEDKGHSNMYMNLFTWMVPCIVPLIFFVCISFMGLTDDSFYVKDKQIQVMFWLNILFTLIAMWFASILIKRWKATGDE